MKNNKNNKNILIGYTKWLLKWLLITAVILGIAIGGFIYYDTEYKNAEVTMLYLSCTSVKLPHQNEKFTQNTTLWKVTKKRNKSTPYGMYLPRTIPPFEEVLYYKIGGGSVNTRPYSDYFRKKIVNPDEAPWDFWTFRNVAITGVTADINAKPTGVMIIGRKSLVSYNFYDNKEKPYSKYNCDLSTKSEYQKSWNELRVRLKDYKI